jgi:hypothetical protein
VRFARTIASNEERKSTEENMGMPRTAPPLAGGLSA